MSDKYYYILLLCIPAFSIWNADLFLISMIIILIIIIADMKKKGYIK